MNKMFKKISLLTIGAGVFGVCAALSVSNASILRATSDSHNSNCHWNHYAEITPTYSEHGVKEYWICCNHHQDGPVFVAPTVGQITNATHPNNFKDTISSTDARYMNPYNETITFESGEVDSFISIGKNISTLDVVDGEGIDGSKALRIINNSWNFGLNFSQDYLSAVFSDPSVVAINFYAKSTVATNDFRRLSNGKGVCYEANTNGYGITTEWKEFSYTRAYYEADVSTDNFIYGGVASGTSTYIDNIHPVKKALDAYGFECGGTPSSTSFAFQFYSPGHSSSGIDNYVAPKQLFYTNASTSIVTSSGFDYEHKSEGIRSFTFTKTNGYMALYLGSEIYSQLGTNDYVSIDIYSTVHVNANSASNWLDGFSNTNLQTKTVNTWQTYNFFKGVNITSDGRFLIIQGSSAGTFCFDNIQIHTASSESETYDANGETYVSSSDTYVEFATRKQVQTLVSITVDDTSILPINNTRNAYIDTKKVVIKKDKIGTGEHKVTVKYLYNGTIYTESKYMNLVEVTTQSAVSTSIAYGDSGYYTLSGYSDIFRITCGNNEVPFEHDGDNLLIPNSALVELLPTVNNKKENGTVNLYIKNLTTTYLLPVQITVSNSVNVKTPFAHGSETLNMHAYSSSSSLTSNSNVQDYINDYTMEQYKNTGLNIWYEQALHVGVNATGLSTGLQELISMATKHDIKVMLSDDFFRDVSRRTETIFGQTVSVGGKNVTINSEADLDAVVEQRLGYYINYPCVFGVSVGDEQTYNQLDVGCREIFGSLHRVLAKLNRTDFTINANLNPMAASELILTGQGSDESPSYSDYNNNLMNERVPDYETYLEKYVEATGNSYIQYDLYPFTSNDKGWKYECKGLDLYTIQNLLIAGKIAKKYNLELRVVTQSLMYYGTREISPLDVDWMNNMLLAFGVKHISYFVYQCRSVTGSEAWIETSTMLDTSGNKNPMYYYMQGMIHQIRNFQNIYMDFDYEWSNLYKYILNYSSSSCYSAGKKLMDEYYNSTYGNLSSVSTSKDWTLVTGLKNKNNSNTYMYAVQNVYNNFDNELLQTVKLTFNKTYSYAIVYEAGTVRYVNMSSKNLTLKLSAGKAAFVIPVE